MVARQAGVNGTGTNSSRMRPRQAECDLVKLSATSSSRMRVGGRSGSNPSASRSSLRKCRFLLGDRRGEKSHEERLRSERSTCQFWMELRANKIWMTGQWQFENLHNGLLWMTSAENQACGFEANDESWVDFIAMSEAFANQLRSITQK